MEFDLNPVAGGESDEIKPQVPGGAGNTAVSVGELNAVGPVFEDFDHGSPGLDLVGVGHGAEVRRKTIEVGSLKCTSEAIAPRS